MCQNFIDIINRIKGRTKIKNLTELGRFVGASQQFVSKKKKENIFPVKWAFKIAQHYGLSTDWIMTGKNPKGKLPEEPQPLLEEIEEWTNELIEADPKRRDWFEIEFCDAFPTFAEWKEKKEKGEREDSQISKAA